jgi:hypothetical protein
VKELKFNKKTLKVKPKTDTLCFYSPHGDLAIFYKNDRSPYVTGEKVIGASAEEATTQLSIRNLTPEEQKNPDTDPVKGGAFSYLAVVVETGTGDAVTLDPDIIIDDPGSGGGGGVARKAKRKPKK